MRPKITKDQVRARATSQSYERGESYYFNDSISEMVRRGNQIEGLCEAGTQPQPYLVRVVLTENGIESTSCTCLYEYGGDCKHAVALLLAYIANPKAFTERASLESLLENREKPELINLIRKMVERYPDLQVMLERPMPSKTHNLRIDTTSFRRELRRALKSQPEWGESGAEATVYSILQTGEEFASVGDWRNASLIYRTILEECLCETEYFYYDEEGDFAYSIDQTIERLSLCFEQVGDDAQERNLILDSLLNVYLTELDAGEVGGDVPDIILRYAQQPDIAAIRARVAAVIKSRRYTDSYQDFLADLDLLDNVDPEVVLTRLREEGLYPQLIGKLLALKRVDEAIQVIREQVQNPYQLLTELARLQTAGFLDVALELAKSTLKKQYNADMAHWLLHHLKQHGERAEYFEWLLRRMRADPRLEHYIELKAGQPAGVDWDKIHTSLLDQLRKEARFDILTRVHLHDEAWEEAWSTLAKVPRESMSMWGMAARLDIEVANKTRHVFPERATPIYKQHVYNEIGQRNREHYQQAAMYLSAMREAYDQLDEPEAWQTLITSIRKEFARLPALQDELRKAKL